MLKPALACSVKPLLLVSWPYTPRIALASPGQGAGVVVAELPPNVHEETAVRRATASSERRTRFSSETSEVWILAISVGVGGSEDATAGQRVAPGI